MALGGLSPNKTIYTMAHRSPRFVDFRKSMDGAPATIAIGTSAPELPPTRTDCAGPAPKLCSNDAIIESARSSVRSAGRLMTSSRQISRPGCTGEAARRANLGVHGAMSTPNGRITRDNGGVAGAGPRGAGLATGGRHARAGKRRAAVVLIKGRRPGSS